MSVFLLGLGYRILREIEVTARLMIEQHRNEDAGKAHPWLERRLARIEDKIDRVLDEARDRK